MMGMRQVMATYQQADLEPPFEFLSEHKTRHDKYTLRRDLFTVYGKTIERLRKEQGISKAELARRSHLPYSQIRRFERSSTGLVLETVFYLAIGFRMRPQDLMAEFVETMKSMNLATVDE